MKNSIKRILLYALICMYSLSGFVTLGGVSSGQAAYSVADVRSEEPGNEASEDENTYVINNSEYCMNSITLSEGKISFKGIPENEEYRYIMFLIMDADGKDYFREVQTFEGGELSYNLEGISIPDGDYELVLLNSSEQYSTYDSFFYESLLKVRDGSLDFKRSPIQELNENEAAQEKTDKGTLAYYLQPGRLVDSDDEEIIRLATELTEGVDSNYEKIRILHDWVANNIYYDWDAISSGDYGDPSATGVLKSRKSVCEGYSSLLTGLLRAAGIPAKKISGYAIDYEEVWTEDYISGENTTGNHAWVEAYCDGRWLFLDATWDSGNSYRNGAVEKEEGLYSYNYFDSGMDFFSATHLRLTKESVLDKEVTDWKLKNSELKIKSSNTLKNGKKAVKLTWTKQSYAAFDGYEIRRFTKKAEARRGSGSTCRIYNVKKSKKTFTDSKSLKVGKTYYYTIYGYIERDGERVYTPISNIAKRTIK